MASDLFHSEPQINNDVRIDVHLRLVWVVRDQGVQVVNKALSRTIVLIVQSTELRLQSFVQLQPWPDEKSVHWIAYISPRVSSETI